MSADARRTTARLAMSALLVCGCAAEPSEESWQRQRETMVQRQIAERGIKNPRVLAAMQKVRRHEFVPDDWRPHAYSDRPLPIGEGQTISQPYIVAYMTEALDPQPGQRVLEVGSGSGYQAAILAELVGEVYTIELLPALAATAQQRLQRLGYRNIHVKAGDGYKGWPDQAPFDAIIVTCGASDVPAPLVEQLRPGGRMVIPVGETGAEQSLRLILKHADGKVEEKELLPVRFVPLRRPAEGKKQ